MQGTQEAWVMGLGTAQAGVERARESAVSIVLAATEARDDMIRRAVKAGVSQAEVGRITGLTRARIHQIVKGA